MNPIHRLLAWLREGWTSIIDVLEPRPYDECPRCGAPTFEHCTGEDHADYIVHCCHECGYEEVCHDDGYLD